MVVLWGITYWIIRPLKNFLFKKHSFINIRQGPFRKCPDYMLFSCSEKGSAKEILWNSPGTKLKACTFVIYVFGAWHCETIWNSTLKNGNFAPGKTWCYSSFNSCRILDKNHLVVIHSFKLLIKRHHVTFFVFFLNLNWLHFIFELRKLLSSFEIQSQLFFF